MMRRHLVIPAVAIALALAASGCTPAPPAPSTTPSSSTGTGTTVTYAEPGGEPLEADVCTPDAEGEHPAVVLVHGGAFEAGDRSSMAALCELVASWGYVGMAVDYRLVPEHTFPTQVEDVDAAVAWLRDPAHASELGVDPDRVALWGSSAGAIIALSAAEESNAAGDPVSAVVGLSAAGDLTPEALALGDPSPALQQAVLAYLGCDSIEECPAAEPASPIGGVDLLPPVLVVHSERDVIPLAQAELLTTSIQAVGGSAELVVVDGDAHGLQLMSTDVRATIERFLSDVL